jgi:RNA polymerase sigma factor (sigma-70 family)
VEPAPEDLEVGAVCGQLYPRLVAAFRSLGVSREDAEDTAQEALAKLAESWDHRRPDRPLAWCYAVGRNAVVSGRRRRAAEARVVRLLGRGEVHEVDASTSDAVRAAVRRLPPRQREAVIHRFFLGLTVEETAASMRCAPGTVTALTHQALTRLRPQFVAGAMASNPEVTTS